MADLEEKKIVDPEEDDDDDEDDEDYVPEIESSGARNRRRRTDGSASEEDSADDDIDDDEDDEVDEEDEDEEGGKQRRKRKRGNCRKRRRRSKNRQPELEERKVEQEAPKKNIDDLWAEFKKGTDDSVSNSSVSNSATSVKDSNSQNVGSKTVKITQEYDFAGEVVKVTKEVAADSKEALQAAFKTKPVVSTPSTSEASKTAPTSASSSTTLPKPSSLAPKPTSGPPIIRRSGGLSALTANLGKKQKMSTLQKTALDWQEYKQEEGLEDELQAAVRSKGSFTERQSFLARADLRQFEIEKSIREKTRKPPTLGPRP